MLSGPRQRSTIFRTFCNIVVGVEGRLYIENSIFGNGTTVFLANWQLDLVFDLVLLRNGEFYSVDNIYGCLSSHVIVWL
jgi:hypothetical protein